MKANPLFGAPSNRAARERYELLVEAVTRAINEADPMSLLEFGAPSDEYSPELGTVVPRVAKASNPEEVRVILREEFEYWFGQGLSSPSGVFEGAASTIWSAVVTFRQRGVLPLKPARRGKGEAE